MKANIKDIKNLLLRNVILSFLLDKEVSINNQGIVYKPEWAVKIIHAFKDVNIEDLNWDTIVHCGNSNDSTIMPFSFALMYYMIDEGIFNEDKWIDVILERREDFSFFPKNSFTSIKYNLAEIKYITPYSLIKVSMGGAGNRTEFYLISNCDKRLYAFIKKFISDGLKNYKRVIFVFLEEIYRDYQADGYLTKFEDFNDETFKKHLDMCLSKETFTTRIYKQVTAHDIEGLIKFYVWIMASMNDGTRCSNFKIFTHEVIKYPYFINRYKDGYVPIALNPNDPVPKEDKLIIRRLGTKLATKDVGNVACIDFSRVEDLKQRELLKRFYWQDDSNASLNNLNKEITKIINFIKYTNGKITLSSVIKYVSSENYNVKRSGYIRRWIVFNNKISPIKDFTAIIEITYSKNKKNNSRLEAYTREETEKLLQEYKKDSTNNENRSQHSNMLCYYIFKMMHSNSMRLESIKSLKVDSLIQIEGTETYVFKVRSKASPIDEEYYNATPADAKLFKEIVSYTDQFRDKCPSKLSEYLFIGETSHLGSVGLISDRFIEKHHARICKQADVRYLPFASASRNFYMQAITLYGEESGWSEFMIASETGHGIEVNEDHYIKRQITELSEKLFHTEVGQINLTGDVRRTTSLSDRQSVEHHTGHCQSSECTQHSNLGCLQCPNFVTTINDIPYHENRILTIDKVIETENNFHEKEFLIIIKKYHIAYLNKLYELKKENEK